MCGYPRPFVSSGWKSREYPANPAAFLSVPRHRRIHIALRQPDVHRRTRWRVAAIGDNFSLGFGDNGVAALQNAQRTQLRQLGGKLLQLRGTACQIEPQPLLYCGLCGFQSPVVARESRAWIVITNTGVERTIGTLPGFDERSTRSRSRYSCSSTRWSRLPTAR